MKARYPRLVVAGTKGDSGKTLVSLGLLLALKERQCCPVAFKKGPDFIDAAWLGWAASSVGRNLDTYIMGDDRVVESFFRHADSERINVVEGNRGLHDGSDPKGTHSTAELAKLLRAPTVLVLPITKTTRTAAAMVLGCKMLDPDLNLAGVVLNQYAGPRHRRVTTQSIEELTGIPVVGAIPKLSMDLIPNRHLGLTTLFEYEGIDQVKNDLIQIAKDYLDLDRILSIAMEAPEVEVPFPNATEKETTGRNLKIGMISDPAFSFYYPENIEALQQRGAEVVKISVMGGDTLPEDLDGLVVGGGFPEVHLDAICENRVLLNQIRDRAEQGMPIYAECGGLMLLGKQIEYQGATYPMAGIFPVELSVSEKPQGHGYCEVTVDRSNPFFTEGTTLRGHEFHYSSITNGGQKLDTAYSVKRGTGCFDKRDGLIYKNVLACYLHLHAVGAPEWGREFIRAAGKYHSAKAGAADLPEQGKRTQAIVNH